MTVWERRLWLLLWPVSVGVVVAGDLGWWVHDVDLRETIPLDVAIGSTTIAAGLIIWKAQPRNRIGPLLVLSGYLWALGGLDGWFHPVPWATSELLAVGHGLVLAHVFYAYPTGRLPSRFSRTVVTLGYSIWVVEVVRVLTLPDEVCALACAHDNPVELWPNESVSSSLWDVRNGLIFAYALTGVATIAVRWHRAGPAGRRTYTPVLAGGLLYAGIHVVQGAVQIGSGTEPDWVFFPRLAATMILPISFLVGLLQSRLDRSAAGELVIEAGGSSASGSLREALARTLHDPSLELAHWLPGRGAFVDAAGHELELPSADGQRVATVVERDGQRLAAIVHDRALLEDPRLVETVSATTGLLLENERLQAELRAQLAELRASRARIVRSGDEERRRLERDLHDGAQQRLLGLGMGLQLIRSRVEEGSEAGVLVDELEAELGRALQELRELARGIHPSVLTEQGLPAAVRALVERLPVPVRVVLPDDSLPQAVETAAYFVVAESLANVAKYAHAEQAWVTVARNDGSVHVEVRDDGIGGAQSLDGSGLQGLADRVGALGGKLHVESPPGGGTRIAAELPCA